MNPRMRAAIAKADAAEAAKKVKIEGPPKPTKGELKLERELQKAIENALRTAGYWPRNKLWIAAGMPPKGWFIHYPALKTQGLPIILDLIILDNSIHYLEMEIKWPGRGYSSVEQVSLCSMANKPTVFSVDEALEEVNKWEKRKDDKATKD